MGRRRGLLTACAPPFCVPTKQSLCFSFLPTLPSSERRNLQPLLVLGWGMSKRYTYEPLGLLQKSSLTLTSPLRWRSKTCPWIFDREGGTRFQLAQDEHAKVSLLTKRLTTVLPAPDPVASDTAFDYVMSAIRARRLGYVSDWVRFASWQPSEWDSWIRSLTTNAASTLERAPATVDWRPHSRQPGWRMAHSVAIFIFIVFAVSVGTALGLTHRTQVNLDSQVAHSTTPTPIASDMLTHRAQPERPAAAPSASHASPPADLRTPGAPDKKQESAVTPSVTVERQTEGSDAPDALAGQRKRAAAKPRPQNLPRNYQALRLQMLRAM